MTDDKTAGRPKVCRRFQLVKEGAHLPHQSAGVRYVPGLVMRSMSRNLPHPPDASLTCGWERKNEEADKETARLRGGGVERVHSDATRHTSAPFSSSTTRVSPARTLPCRIVRAMSVSALLCRYRLSGRAP